MNNQNRLFGTLKLLMLSALACMMLMIVLPDQAMAAIKYSGSCGENVTWTLDDQGLLTISGSGPMKEYGNKDKEWNVTDKRWAGLSIGDQVKKIVVEEGVTTIGSDAFYYLRYCKTIEIASTVTKIGKRAFGYTNRLESLTYHGDESIWESAIEGVSTGLSSVVVIKCIGAVVFEAMDAEILVPLGDTAVITVNASSKEGDIESYTWYFKDPDSDTFKKAAETSNTYSFRMVEEKNGRIMYCVVKDSAGNEGTSRKVLIRVPKTLTITKQPVDITAGMNSKNTFSLTAEGEGLTYAWYYQNEKGRYEHASTNPQRLTYTTTFLAKRNNRKLYCIVTDQFGNTLKSDVVQIHIDPLIITQPKTMYGSAGSLMKFTIVAQGEGLTYRWFYKNKDSYRYTESTQTGSTYSTRAYYDGRQIYCLVTNASGVTSKSDVVTMYVGVPTVITQNLTDVTAVEGKQAVFSVGATGNGLKYTWYYKSAGRNAFTKSSETDPTYVTKATLARDGRQIYCVITDSHGLTYTTETVTLHVTPLETEPETEPETEEVPADTILPEASAAETEAVVEETAAAEETEIETAAEETEAETEAVEECEAAAEETAEETAEE